MAPLVFKTYYPGWTAAFLWLAVIRTCFRVSIHMLADMQTLLLIPKYISLLTCHVDPCMYRSKLVDMTACIDKDAEGRCHAVLGGSHI